MLGVLPGIVGSLQANEALKLVLGIGDSLQGRLLLLDALGTTIDEVSVQRDPSCPSAASTRRSPSTSTTSRFCQSPAPGGIGSRRAGAGSASVDPGKPGRSSRMTRLRIPPTLRNEVGGERELVGSGDTVREVLEDLSGRYPALSRSSSTRATWRRSSTSTSAARTCVRSTGSTRA